MAEVSSRLMQTLGRFVTKLSLLNDFGGLSYASVGFLYN